MNKSSLENGKTYNIKTVFAFYMRLHNFLDLGYVYVFYDVFCGNSEVVFVKLSCVIPVSL
jgi:hypothetical protein